MLNFSKVPRRFHIGRGENLKHVFSSVQNNMQHMKKYLYKIYSRLNLSDGGFGSAQVTVFFYSRRAGVFEEGSGAFW